ncbi:Retrovirus-related Pol polyprotein from transposon opus [Vitis vinifera]|uniref:RNA-directed DNA polymerase n=1 Tax=Vitis vinifera TaxID=29760 RepID=A0A438CPL2_VITVI|nr:Retrovirus-related Pol polyprotein from transposon opus [Vitis vinifera]
MNANSEKELIKEELMKKRTSPPFPQALHGKKGIKNASEILEVLSQVKVNIPLLDMIMQVPTYAKFLKDLLQRPGMSYHFSHDWRKVVEKALLDLGASVNLLPYSVYKQLGLGELKPTSITLSLADRLVKIPREIIEDVLVQVDNFYYPVDFVVLDTDPLNGLMQLTFGNMTLELNIFHMSKKLITPEKEEGPEEVCIIDTLVEEHCDQNMQDELNESLEDLEEGLSEIANVLATLQGWRRKKEILPLFNKEEGQDDVTEEFLKLNLKPLPMELKYTYLEENNQCPVVISSSLTGHQEISLLEVLKRCKKAIGWQISDLKGIEVVRTEVLKLLQAGIIYPISENPWVSPTQVVPKKSSITVVQNEKGKEIATRLTSGYFQIEIDVEDQEKTTFTCPFGTYAYRRMPFGLCNAPATFQRCMLSIFSDMVERIMEVFMDDITIYGEMPFYGTSRNCPWPYHSKKDIEVDKAKVELIAKLPSPTTVKGVSQFLGHAGFYRRFIQDFSKLSRPLCELLAKDGKSCTWTKRRWEALCDLLCKQNMNEAQRNYTTTEKELLAVVFALDKFRAYLVGSFIIVFTDHSALKDKKGVENVVADHLSRALPFKYCADQIIRKCVLKKRNKGSSATTMRMPVEVTLPLRNSHEGLAIRTMFPNGVEAIPCKHNDHRVVLKFLKENIFSRFGVPKAIISDDGTHFCNKPFEALLAKYGVKHKVATPYHPQTSGQVELA